MERLHEGTMTICAHMVSFWYKGNCPVSEDLATSLDNEAESRARECISENCVQGELLYEDEKCAFSGWWKIET